ncbi:unnamed protein product [Heligmosomoides polygyrus]|uniref:LAGLIDADG_2 domain-containing protein n=1 Tax=Heligmosomoides polygyrus TaxID=6339 RepID=A0A183G092_HELPZ|nr:unnamed protein product [Heligmosomoides polygyrus]
MRAQLDQLLKVVNSLAERNSTHESRNAVRPGKTPAGLHYVLSAHENEGTVYHSEFDSLGAARDKGSIRRMRILHQVFTLGTLREGIHVLLSRHVQQLPLVYKPTREHDKEKTKALIASLRQWGCRAVGRKEPKQGGAGSSGYRIPSEHYAMLLRILEEALDSGYDVTEDVGEFELKGQQPFSSNSPT